MKQEDIKNIIEAILMVSENPLNLVNISKLLMEDPLSQISKDDIRIAIETLQKEYKGHGIELVEVASGFRFQTKMKYSKWVVRLFDERPQRYSKALLETLSIITYRQPVTRAEIEDIRGVSVSSSIIRTLMEREWIKVVGYRDMLGKPELLSTTAKFLDYFNIKKISDLPELSEIKELNYERADLFDALDTDKKDLKTCSDTSIDNKVIVKNHLPDNST